MDINEIKLVVVGLVIVGLVGIGIGLGISLAVVSESGKNNVQILESLPENVIDIQDSLLQTHYIVSYRCFEFSNKHVKCQIYGYKDIDNDGAVDLGKELDVLIEVYNVFPLSPNLTTINKFKKVD